MTEDESGETRSNGSPNGLERAQPNRSAEPLMSARGNNGTGCACVGVWSGFLTVRDGRGSGLIAHTVKRQRDPVQTKRPEAARLRDAPSRQASVLQRHSAAHEQ